MRVEGSSKKKKNKRKQKKGGNMIQGLFDTCKEVFAECGPGIVPCQDDVARLSSFLDTIKPEDIGLNLDLPFFSRVNSEAPPPITYLHIYACPQFSIGIFCLPQSAVIPLHNHPGMTVFSKILFGSMHIKSYDWVNNNEEIIESREGERLAKVKTNTVYNAPCETSILYPETGGNMHCFTAVTSCAVLDVMGPPYSANEGRDCIYYDDFPFSHFSGSMEIPSESEKYAWLKARTEIPGSFKLDIGEYMGPKIVDK